MNGVRELRIVQFENRNDKTKGMDIRGQYDGFVRRALLVAGLVVSVAIQGCERTCRGENVDVGTRLSVTPTELSFAAEGGTQVLVLDADGPWTVESPEDGAWISLSVEEGSTSARIAVTASRYIGTTDRFAVLEVEYDGGTQSEKVRIDQSRPQVDRPDTDGTANCYMVAPGSTQLIEATYRGNSRTERVGRWTTAELLWQDVNGLIRTVEYDSSLQTILFSTAFKSGNALVGVRDEAGRVLWSWHIWVTDYDPSVGTIDYAPGGGSGWTFMDRNLGAMNAESGDFGAFGLLYQWGRKDPFTAAAEFSDIAPRERPLYDIEGRVLPSMGSLADEYGRVDLGIENPMTFYGTRYATADWSEESDDDRWGGESFRKTVYDPCPVGWKVPVCDAEGRSPYGFVTYDGSTWIEFAHGLLCGGIWFPASGSRVNGTGQLHCTGEYAGLWIGTAGTANVDPAFPQLYGQFMSIIWDERMLRTLKDYRSQGMSVRCVRE